MATSSFASSPRGHQVEGTGGGALRLSGDCFAARPGCAVVNKADLSAAWDFFTRSRISSCSRSPAGTHGQAAFEILEQKDEPKSQKSTTHEQEFPGLGRSNIEPWQGATPNLGASRSLRLFSRASVTRLLGDSARVLRHGTISSRIGIGRSTEAFHCIESTRASSCLLEVAWLHDGEGRPALLRIALRLTRESFRNALDKVNGKVAERSKAPGSGPPEFQSEKISWSQKWGVSSNLTLVTKFSIFPICFFFPASSPFLCLLEACGCIGEGAFAGLACSRTAAAPFRGRISEIFASPGELGGRNVSETVGSVGPGTKECSARMLSVEDMMFALRVSGGQAVWQAEARDERLSNSPLPGTSTPPVTPRDFFFLPRPAAQTFWARRSRRRRLEEGSKTRDDGTSAQNPRHGTGQPGS